MRRSSGNITIVLYSRAVSCHIKTYGFRFSWKASVSENWNPMKHHHPSIPKECWRLRDLFRLLSHHHHHHPQQQTEQPRAWYYCKGNCGTVALWHKGMGSVLNHQWGLKIPPLHHNPQPTVSPEHHAHTACTMGTIYSRILGVLSTIEY